MVIRRPIIGFAALPLIVLASTVPVRPQSVSASRARATESWSKLLEIMKVGQTAKDVTFEPLKGEAKIKLSDLTKDGSVVLVVLRGFPGYQCPLCTRQVADLRRNAEEFAKLNAKVVLVYPGPGPTESLKKKAQEFLAGTELPKPFVMMVDPEYAFTNLYELRWNASQETSYPSTFVLDKQRVVKFRKISETHAGRAPTKEILLVLNDLQRDPAPTATVDKK